MADSPKDSDQSMEDILQSIKRIIADESDPAASMPGSDVLELTELLEEDAAPPSVTPPAPEPVAPPPPPAAPAAAAPSPKAEPAPASTEHLMSDDTFAASAAALKALANRPVASTTSVSPTFRSGTTVEDLVMEALKPMIKEWLDGNLPSMVRSLVEREIRRLSGV